MSEREPRRVSPYEIPTVADYSHWNEDAQAVWYAENRYDMEHPEEAREAWEADHERDERDDPDPFQTVFATREEAQAFIDALDSTPESGSEPLDGHGDWYVEHYSCNEKGQWTGRPCVLDMRHRGMHRYFVWPPLPTIEGVTE